MERVVEGEDDLDAVHPSRAATAAANVIEASVLPSSTTSTGNNSETSNNAPKHTSTNITANTTASAQEDDSIPSLPRP